VYDYELKIGWGKSVALPSQALPAPPPGKMAIRNKEVASFVLLFCFKVTQPTLSQAIYMLIQVECSCYSTPQFSLMILFLYFIQGATVILSGPGGPPAASITPQNLELVGKILIVY
jgi:hypothetical protein